MGILRLEQHLDVNRSHPLSYTKYLPQKNPTKALLISSATGVPQQFYRKFANYFAENDFVVYTFDYSGIGNSGSSVGQLKSHKGGVKGWGSIDQAKIVDLIQSQHPDLKVVLVTHSIGGQMLGFNPLNHIFERAVMAASQSGYWQMFDGFNRVKLLLFWYFFIPIFTPIFGYFPGRKLGIFENLPKSMALEWRKWGVEKNYFMHYYNKSDYFFDKVKFPIRMYSFPKDPYAAATGVDWLAAQYKNAEVERIHYQSKNKEKQPKHFGFFREEFKEELWGPTLDWLKA